MTVDELETALEALPTNTGRYEVCFSMLQTPFTFQSLEPLINTSQQRVVFATKIAQNRSTLDLNAEILALLDSLDEVRDVYIEDDIVRVSLEDGSVWDFTTPTLTQGATRSTGDTLPERG